MKKRYLIGMVIGIVMCVLMGSVNADLIDRGGGLIYDTDLNVTWLQDANYAKTSGYDTDGYMTWVDAMAWASSLEYQGYSDWRLPTIGTLSAGWTTNSNGEFPHLSLVDQISQKNPDPFIIAPQYYWTTYGNSSSAWFIGFSSSFPITGVYQNNMVSWCGNQFAAWAVRDGDSTPVPEPATMLLLGSGLIGLAGYGRKKLFKK
jgi:hypothetical protein